MGRFKVGDRVEVRNNLYDGFSDDYLQENNRVGTIEKAVLGGCWLRMDKLVILDDWSDRPSTLPQGFTYYALPGELELLKSAESQKLLDVWSFGPPKVKRESQDESIPDVWGNRVLVNT